MQQKPPVASPLSVRYLRTLVWSLVALLTMAAMILILLLDMKVAAVSSSLGETKVDSSTLPPLPIGVDPIAKQIDENPDVDAYMAEFVASNHTKPAISDSWFDRALAALSEHDWYQNLATPATRILIIQSGERHEEIARNFGRILRWDATEKTAFSERLLSEVPTLKDGKLYPGRYVIASNAGGEEVAVAVADRFNAEVRTRYTDALAETIPLEDALIIASLIEREAYDFTDMRFISGVIWNRLFIDMKLQIDATLQYARGEQSAAAGGRFWPVPRPEDKFIKSPYNTYQNVGLPPAPIANPSIDAIIAALNPRATDCLFYYHTDDGTFYCNATYEGHVAGIKQHLKN